MADGSGFPYSPSDYLTDQKANALARLFDEAVRGTQSRITFYEERGLKFSKYARFLRRTALFLFIFGTLTPIAGLFFAQFRAAEQAEDSAASSQGDVFLTSLAKSLAQFPLAELGYLLLALGGGFVLYDQFFGTSRSWMRYRQAEAKLHVMLAKLKYAWASKLAEMDGRLTDCQAVAALTGLLAEHATGVEALAEAETLEWAEQFRAQIDVFDQKLKAAQGAQGGLGGGPPEEPAQSGSQSGPAFTGPGRDGAREAPGPSGAGAGDAAPRADVEIDAEFVPHEWRDGDEEGDL